MSGAKGPRFIVVHAERNGFLFRFDLGWFTHCQDDPSCWTDERAKAGKFTQKQIDKMVPYIAMFQGQPTIEEVR